MNAIAKFIPEQALDEDDIAALFDELLENAINLKAEEWGGFAESHTDPAELISELERIRPTLVGEPPRSSVTALQEWEGYVLTIDRPHKSFTARLLDLTVNDKAEKELAEFDISELSESDDKLLQEGAVFRWVIGNQITRGGQKRRISQIIFRRMPAWTQREIDEARREAKELSRAIQWD
jgi:hypothetical protein